MERRRLPRLNAFEDDRPVIGQVELSRPIKARVAATVGVLVFRFSRHGEDWPGGIPEFAVAAVRQVQLVEGEVPGPPPEIQHHEIVAPVAPGKGEDLSGSEVHVQGRGSLDARVTPEPVEFVPPVAHLPPVGLGEIVIEVEGGGDTEMELLVFAHLRAHEAKE